MFVFTGSFGKELQKLCYFKMKLILLGVVFLATVSSQVFSPTTIVSRNCTHISFKTKINPNGIGLIFFWRAVTINGSSSVTVSYRIRKLLYYFNFTKILQCLQFLKATTVYCSFLQSLLFIVCGL